MSPTLAARCSRLQPRLWIVAGHFSSSPLAADVSARLLIPRSLVRSQPGPSFPRAESCSKRKTSAKRLRVIHPMCTRRRAELAPSRAETESSSGSGRQAHRRSDSSARRVTARCSSRATQPASDPTEGPRRRRPCPSDDRPPPGRHRGHASTRSGSSDSRGGLLRRTQAAGRGASELRSQHSPAYSLGAQSPATARAGREAAETQQRRHRLEP